MKAKISFAVAGLFSIVGCAESGSKLGSPVSKASVETVLITYHVIPGKEKELERTLATAWNVYRKERLVFEQPHVVIRGDEGTGKTRFVEIFTWVSPDAPDHAPPSVQALWEQMKTFCEARDGHTGIDGATVNLLTANNAPAMP